MMLACSIKDRSESMVTAWFLTSLYVVGGTSISLGHMVVGR